MPLPIGWLMCQRSNCWWDAKLRRRYAVWVVGTGSPGRADPRAPVFVIGIRQFTGQRQAATRFDDLKKHSERLWREALSGEVAAAELTRRSPTCEPRTLDGNLMWDTARLLLRCIRTVSGMRLG